MFAVVERKLVVAASCFEGMFRHPNTDVCIAGSGGDIYLEDNTTGKIRAIDRARLFLSVVAFFRLIAVVPQDFCVVALDDFCHVTRAAIADFGIFSC